MAAVFESVFEVQLVSGRGYAGQVNFLLQDGHAKDHGALSVDVVALPEFNETDMGVPKRAMSPSVERFDAAVAVKGTGVVINVCIRGDRKFMKLVASTGGGRLLNAAYTGSRQV